MSNRARGSPADSAIGSTQSLTALERLGRRLNVLRALALGLLVRPSLANDWRDLKGLYTGRRAFLIGNGPSLNQTPLHLLKDEVTICFNRFGLFLERLDWTPTMYMVVDGLVAANISDEINAMSARVDHTFLTRYALATGMDFRSFAIDRPNVHWMLPKPLQTPFDFNLPSVNVGGSVAVAAIQVLHFLGFREIILIGVDMNQQLHANVDVIRGNSIRAKRDDDPNHFDPRYFGAGREYHQPDRFVVETILKSFARLASVLEGTECRVLNASPGSRVASFQRIAMPELFPDYARRNVQRFQESFLALTGHELVAERERAARVRDRRLILVPVEETQRAIKALAPTHLPLGPLDGSFHFFSRDAISMANGAS